MVKVTSVWTQNLRGYDVLGTGQPTGQVDVVPWQIIFLPIIALPVASGPCRAGLLIRSEDSSAMVPEELRKRPAERSSKALKSKANDDDEK